MSSAIDFRSVSKILKAEILNNLKAVKNMFKKPLSNYFRHNIPKCCRCYQGSESPVKQNKYI
jgi:hypothetical protein